MSISLSRNGIALRRRDATRPRSRYVSALRTPKAIVGLSILGVLVVTSLLAPVFAPAGYDAQTANSLAGASINAPLGTDELGRDVFDRTLYGLRTDLSLVVFAVPISMVIGTLLGLSGAIAGWLGEASQRLFDVILGFPSIILGISIVLVLSPGWTALAVAIVIYGLPGFGRLARAGLLQQEQREFVMAARVLGVPKRTIMVRHILPNALDPIIVQAAITVVGAIFLEAALSIVGLGIQPPEPSLGALLNTGIRYIAEQPAYVLGPTAVLLLLALAFSLLSDALNEAVNRR